MTRLQWLITFIVDLESFEHFLNKISANINITSMTAQRVHTISTYYTPEKKQFLSTLLNIQKELGNLSRTRNNLMTRFYDCKSFVL